MEREIIMKTVDVNERTLEQEKQYLKKTSEIIRIEAVCFAIALILLTVRDIIPSVSAEGADISVMFWVKMGALPFQAAAAIVVSNFVIKLFKEIENGDTPFRYSVADKMKGLSDAVMASGIIFALPQFVNQILSIFTDIPDKTSNSAGVIVLGALFLGLVFKALSYIFNYGCKLQQESDETL